MPVVQSPLNDFESFRSKPEVLACQPLLSFLSFRFGILQTGSIRKAQAAVSRGIARAYPRQRIRLLADSASYLGGAFNAERQHDEEMASGGILSARRGN